MRDELYRNNATLEIILIDGGHFQRLCGGDQKPMERAFEVSQRDGRLLADCSKSEMFLVELLISEGLAP